MITNENNDVKVVDKDGNFKWIQKHIATDKQIMHGQGLAIVEAPLKFEDSEPNSIILNKPYPVERFIFIENDTTNVAEVKSAEKTNKTKK